MHVLDILKELKSHTGKGSAGRKMDILLQHKDNKDLRDFFYWCLEPSINYWQTKITDVWDAPLTGDILNFRDAMKFVLDCLVTRIYTGNTAKRLLGEYVYDLSPDDREIMNRIITGKPDVGFNISTVNKVWPNLIYDPAYMRCSGYSPEMVKTWDFEDDWIISQIKADGMFVNIISTNWSTKMETRSGEPLPKVVAALDIEQRSVLQDMVTDLWHINMVIHAELIVWKDGLPMERSKSNGLINKVKLGGKLPKNCKIYISIWDAIPRRNFLEHIPFTVPYMDRFNLLIRSIEDNYRVPSVDLIEYKMVKSQIEAQAHFIEALKRGLEGTVLKHGSLIWKNHTSTKQLKLKNKFRFEMRIVGFTEGEGKFAKTFGSMLIESECGLLKSAISGMTDKVRNYIYSNKSKFLDSVVEIEANGLFENDDGSYGIMHPRYKEHRTDRIEADTLERIIQQEIDSIMGKEIEDEGK